MDSRLEKLFEIIGCVSVSRTLIHSLVYLLEFKYGFDIGYRDCSWKNTVYGLYCEDIERDLEALEKRGVIVIDRNGFIRVNRGYRQEVISQDEAYSILKEAVKHYIINFYKTL